MVIKEILYEIGLIAKKNGISTPYITGGLPRDKIIERAYDVDDIDLTTGDNTIHQLARLCAQNYLNKGIPISYRVMPDTHAQIQLPNVRLDFSSNYNSAFAEQFLKKTGVKITPLIKEMVSRDFTCNTLLISLDLKTIHDPTGMAIRDIKKKLIRTNLPPRITLSESRNRIVRVIYLAAKLGFDVGEDIITFVKSNPGIMQQTSKPKYIINKLNKAKKYDHDKVNYLMFKMGLL